MSSHVPLSPDDPRVTAYALGELEGAERAEIDAAVQRNPALQEAVAEIRALAGDLEATLAAEPVPAAVPMDASVATYPLGTDRKRRVVPFPYVWVAGLAAAGFAVLVAVRDDHSPVASKKERVIQYEVNLQAPLVQSDSAEPEPDEALAETSAAVAPESWRADLAAGLALAPAPESAAGSLSLPTTPASEARLVTTPMTFDAAMPEIAGTTLRQQPAPAESRSVTYSSGVAPIQPASPPVAVRRFPAPELQHTNHLRRSSAPLAQFLHTTVGEREQSAILPVPTTPSVEHYAAFDENPFMPTAGNPLSTFALDVDTASYTNVRRFLERGQRPPRDAVRIEELVNYFPYGYAAPAADSEAPLTAHLEVAPAPWAPEHRLVRIGLKARDFSGGARAPANLVFLIDVSGSMAAPEKLPLVKESLRVLLARLQPDDRVAIVTYAGTSGLALPSTPVRQSREIHEALDGLEPGGTTNGASGIHLAYDIAKANFVSGGINRVILCTDGDFNVGVTSTGDLGRLIGEKASTGVFLTALGFGMGNYRDDTLERLASRGNGRYGYIDTASEARKLLADEVNGTLAVVARDVKVQVEFNPTLVQAYRLLGYENRLLSKEDFNRDSVDAGEMGAGQTVTALYEVVPTGVAWKQDAEVDPLKYQPAAETPRAVRTDVRRADASTELLTVKVRYQQPAGGASRRLEFAVEDRGTRWDAASADYRFAAAVAGFGMALRESPHRGSTTFAQVLAWAQTAISEDPGGHRRDFLALVRRAMDVIGD
jgi:Ca-activated chloride channel homolog